MSDWTTAAQADASSGFSPDKDADGAVAPCPLKQKWTPSLELAPSFFTSGLKVEPPVYPSVAVELKVEPPPETIVPEPAPTSPTTETKAPSPKSSVPVGKASPVPVPGVSLPTPTLTWIEIALVGEDGAPLSGIRYELKLADGTIHAGTLGSDGLVRVDEIKSGKCSIRFPDLDRDSWSPVG